MNKASEAEDKALRGIYWHNFRIDMSRRPIRTLTELFLFRVLRFMLVLMYVGVGYKALKYFLALLLEDEFGLQAGWLGQNPDRSVGLLDILAQLDGAMIANAFYIILGGGYLVYVRSNVRDSVFLNEDRRPRAFQHLTTVKLYAKMTGSFVGISGLVIMRNFIISSEEHGHAMPWDTFWQLIIAHLTFVLTYVVFWATDHWSSKAHGDADTTAHKPLHAVAIPSASPAEHHDNRGQTHDQPAQAA